MNAPAPGGSQMPKDSHRLPSGIEPTRYDIELAPDLEEFTFAGRIEIDLNILEPTASITLNAAELEISDAQVVTADEESHVGTVASDPARETVTVALADQLEPGPARLKMEFTGLLNDRLRGFYRSRYTDAEGAVRHLASTQFEATDARRAFPCWDEPSLKAEFSVTLVVPEQMAAISNMPEEQVSVSDGKKSVRFATTPPMSTYLLAFVVGDMRCIEQRTESGTLMRVWATTGNEESGGYALDVSVKLLAYLNDYFGMPYPLPKLDHVAIPDFAAGAMENWGCITYREPALLVDPTQSSAGTRQLVAEIVAHEMAHMWFGDLVTMAWWNDLWLNESFASWMGDKAVADIYPEWDKWDQFLVDETSRALKLDGLRSTHPIEQAVDDPAEIGQLFDAISYSKGAAIIRMLESHLGEAPFRKGVNLYLGRHIHANATTSDLWDALGAASKQPVREIMDSWTSQAGYPYLSITVDRGAKETRLAVTQRRFAYEAITESDESDETLWHVPVAAFSHDGQAASGVVSGRSDWLVIPSTGEGWLKVNPQHTGFYRVRYSPEELASLSSAVVGCKLSPADRLGLVGDAFALNRAGMIPIDSLVNLVGCYRDEENRSVWATLTSHLSGLDALTEDEPFHPALRGWCRDLLGLICERVGWEPSPDEGHLDSLLRGDVLLAAGRFGDQQALNEASVRFDGLVKGTSSVAADLRRVVFALAAMSGDRTTYETMWQMHEAAQLQEEKVRLLSALTQFPQRELVSETLERSFTDRVRAHETIGVIVRTAATSLGRDLAWQFLQDNWEEVDRRYGEGGFGLMYLVEITAGFTTQERMLEVERFFAENPTPAADRTVRQCIEKIGLNVAWLARNRADLARALEAR